MKILLLLVTAPLVLVLAQPARPALNPAQSRVSLDSHVVRHPKSKRAAARIKSGVKSTDKISTKPGGVGATVATPLPAVHPRAKTPRNTPPL